MDDVDYLIEDNAMDDFCLSSEMDGSHGRTTFEDDLTRIYRGGQPMVEWHNGGASWEQNANVGNVSSNWEKLNRRE